MKKRKNFYRLFFVLALLFWGFAGISSGDEMEIIAEIDIAVTPRQEWYPSISYNSTDKEFMVLWHTSGKIKEDCDQGDDYDCSNDFHTVDGQRISADGELLGDPFQLSPPELGWKTLPKSSYNINRNEYMVIFSAGDEFLGQKVYKARMDNEGNLLESPELLPIDQYKVSHPVISINTSLKEYLVGLNDTVPGVVAGEEDSIDNFVVLLDEDGELINGPTLVGSHTGTQFNPQMTYNTLDNTFFMFWEDFRDVEWILDNCDLYGALLDDEGNMVGEERHVIVDFGMDDEGSAQNQNIAYNNVDNEFLVAWGADEQASLEDWGGLVGRILNGDGTPKGDPFVISDERLPQNSPQMIYVREKQKYFIVWADYRDDTALGPGTAFYYAEKVDIYGKWLETTGESAGPDIPICTDDGVQGWPTLSYDRIKDRILIAWYDTNASDEYEILPGGGGGMVFPQPSNVRGVIYGSQATTTTTVPTATTTTTTPQDGAIGGCPAVAMYGESADETNILRGFRDIVLKNIPGGRNIINMYYKFGPHVVNIIEKNATAKKIVKTVVDSMLPFVKL